MWVFDATPLIYLSKAERLELLSHLDAPRVIPQRVYEEVVDGGIEEGYPDARRIEQCVEDGVFEVVGVSEAAFFERLLENENLSDADVSVLAYADSRDGVAVMDETYGRDVAATEGVETRGTAFLVLLLVKDGVIDAEAGREIVDAMLEAGWYCAPDMYAKVVQKLDSV
jgi:predicted nucleic acid-binding protein